ncbi:MAG: ABC transporter permease [Bdellovibrionales bacterium]
MKTLRHLGPFLSVFAALLLTLEILVRSGALPDSLFPSPSQILAAFWESPDEWRLASFETGQHALQGLALSFFVGGAVSLLLSLSLFLKRAFLPLSLFFQTVPIIAIAPLLVIYFGFGAPTVVASATLVSFFPVMASFLLGLETVEREKLELFQLYGASRWQTLMKLRLPNAFLALYSGLKVAVGLSLVGAVAGEFVAGSGLGALIDASRTAQRVDRVFVALFLLALMGLLFLSSLRGIFSVAQKIRPFGRDSQEWS